MQQSVNSLYRNYLTWFETNYPGHSPLSFRDWMTWAINKGMVVKRYSADGGGIVDLKKTMANARNYILVGATVGLAVAALRKSSAGHYIGFIALGGLAGLVLSKLILSDSDSTKPASKNSNKYDSPELASTLETAAPIGGGGGGGGPVAQGQEPAPSYIVSPTYIPPVAIITAQTEQRTPTSSYSGVAPAPQPISSTSPSPSPTPSPTPISTSGTGVSGTHLSTPGSGSGLVSAVTKKTR